MPTALEPIQFHATLHPVLNRGTPPVAFLRELVAWGRTAADDIFAPNTNPADVYATTRAELGPWTDNLQRRAAMLEILRVLAGFESGWNWNEGRDVNNRTSVTPTTIEAGEWQVSANSELFGADLVALVKAHAGNLDPNVFQRAMKLDHPLAMEYIARLLRHTVRHNGPVLNLKINPWLRRDAVAEFQSLLSA